MAEDGIPGKHNYTMRIDRSMDRAILEDRMPAQPATFSGRRYARFAAALAAGAGFAVATLILLQSAVADFLAEGPPRLLGLSGDNLQNTLGAGAAIGTVFAAWGAHVFRHNRLRGGGALALGLGLGLFLSHVLFLPTAVLLGAAVALDALDGLPRTRFGNWAPRAHPVVWIFGGIGAIALLTVVITVGTYLAAPLVDEGAEVHEPLGFDAPSLPAPASGSPTGATAVLAEGLLEGADSFHTGEGGVRIIRTPQGGHIVRFENFSVRNGPDLFVYVTPDPEGDTEADGAENISPLRATSGDVSYDIPPAVDAKAIRAVVIYCKQFRITFATAKLTPA